MKYSNFMPWADRCPEEKKKCNKKKNQQNSDMNCIIFNKTSPA